MNRLNLTLPGAVALRNVDFRRYWTGHVMAVSGQQMLWVAQGWLIYELSGSAILLGVAGLARAIPATALSLVGGAMADKVDQRRLLVGLQIAQMGLLALLGTLTLLEEVRVWHLMLIVSLSSGMLAFENPARQAIFPRLVPRAALMDAVAANSTIHPGARFFGPVLGGLLMAQIRVWTDLPLAGAATMFYITALGYLLNARFLYLIHLPRIEGSGKKSSMIEDVSKGIRLIVRSPIFSVLIGMTYCSQFFGWSMQSLFPIFAKDVFNGGEFELGLLYSSLGAGSLVGAAVASNLTGVRRRGRLIIAGFIAGGAILLLFSVVPVFELALAVLVVLGVAQAQFNVSAQSTLHHLVPDEFRGRVMGVWGMTHTSVQPMGQLQMGAMAALLSAPLAVTLGGVAIVVVGVMIAVSHVRLRNLTIDGDRTSEAAREPREAAPSAARAD